MTYSTFEGYKKIKKCIASSKNKLHLDTCIVMIALFNLQKEDEYPEAKEEMDMMLKQKLDKRAVELGLLVI